MNRKHHLKYCKICVNQKFDLQQGVICNMTNQKADFEERCEGFIIDEARLQEINSLNNSERQNKGVDLEKLGEHLLMIFLGIGFFIWTEGIPKTIVHQILPL